MGAPYTLAQLLQALNLDQVRAKYLGGLQGAGFPAITEWVPRAGAEMAHVGQVSGSVADLIAADLPVIVAGGHLGLASNPAYNASLYLTLLAHFLYLLERNPATSTTFNLKLSSNANADPYTFDPGDVWVAAPSGNRYQSTTGGQLQPGESFVLAFQAEHPGSSYADDPTTSNFTLVTAFAGVTLSAATADFSTVAQVGGSTGQIIPTRTSENPLAGPLPHTFQIQITVAGEIGSAQWELAVDGIAGGAFVNQGVLLASNDLPGGTTILAVAGSGSPSFEAGDIFQFATPAGSGYVQGSDEESDISLATRCRSRWATLSQNPTEAVFTLWAVLAYPAASRISVSPDLVVPGRVNLIAADSHGPLDVDALAKIFSYIRPKLRSVLDDFQAFPAQAAKVATAGTVRVLRNKLTAVQQASQNAWIAALGATPLGPSEVELSTLNQVLMDAGAAGVDLSTLRLNGAAANLQLVDRQVPVDGNGGGGLAGAMTWVIAA